MTTAVRNTQKIKLTKAQLEKQNQLLAQKARRLEKKITSIFNDTTEVVEHKVRWAKPKAGQRALSLAEPGKVTNVFDNPQDYYRWVLVD